jgi:hypothetical protein
MSGTITMLLLFTPVLAGYVLARLRARRGRDPWYLLRDLGPVSGQWLADCRRSGPATPPGVFNT